MDIQKPSEIKLEEDIAGVTFVDDVEALEKLADRVKNCQTIGFDLKGFKIGRDNTVSCLQLSLPRDASHSEDDDEKEEVTPTNNEESGPTPRRKVRPEFLPSSYDHFSVDVQTIGPDVVFGLLKEPLESALPIKVVFDVRRDSECLYHQHGVTLSQGIFDLQVAEYSMRCLHPSSSPFLGSYGGIFGLLERRKAIPPQEGKRIGDLKTRAREFTKQNPTAYSQRPLPDLMAATNALDVKYLLPFYHCISRNAGSKVGKQELDRKTFVGSKNQASVFRDSKLLSDLDSWGRDACPVLFVPGFDFSSLRDPLEVLPAAEEHKRGLLEGVAARQDAIFGMFKVVKTKDDAEAAWTDLEIYELLAVRCRYHQATPGHRTLTHVVISYTTGDDSSYRDEWDDEAEPSRAACSQAMRPQPTMTYVYDILAGGQSAMHDFRLDHIFTSNEFRKVFFDGRFDFCFLQDKHGITVSPFEDVQIVQAAEHYLAKGSEGRSTVLQPLSSALKPSHLPVFFELAGLVTSTERHEAALSDAALRLLALETQCILGAYGKLFQQSSLGLDRGNRREICRRALESFRRHGGYRIDTERQNGEQAEGRPERRKRDEPRRETGGESSKGPATAEDGDQPQGPERRSERPRGPRRPHAYDHSRVDISWFENLIQTV